MLSFWIRMGLNPIMSVLVRDKNRGQRERQSEKAVKRWVESGTPTNQEISGWGPHWDLKVGTERFSHRGPWKGLTLNEPRFWTSDPRIVGK